MSAADGITDRVWRFNPTPSSFTTEENFASPFSGMWEQHKKHVIPRAADFPLFDHGRFSWIVLQAGLNRLTVHVLFTSSFRCQAQVDLTRLTATLGTVTV